MFEMPSSRESERSSNLSNEDEEFLLIISGLPRYWRWQELKDLVRKWAPQVKHAYTYDKQQAVGNVGVITIKNKAKVNKVYEELSDRMVEGRPLRVEIRTSTGETLTGPISYELPSTLPATSHNPREQVILPLVISPSFSSTAYHANGAPEMQANYNVSDSFAWYHLTPVTMNTALQASPEYNRRTSTIQRRRPSHETALISAEPFGQQFPPGLPTSLGYVASMSPTGYTSAVPMAAFTAQPMLISLHEGVIASSQGIPPPSREALQVCAAMPNTPGPEPAPNESQRTIYIQNVHYQATWKDLENYLRGKTAGHVDHCRIFNGGRGIAIFRTAEEAERAVRDVDGNKFQGMRLKITLNEPVRKEDLEASVEKLSTFLSAGRDSKGTGPLVVDGTQLVMRRKVKC